MDHKQQTIAFAEDIDRLVDRYSDEFDLTYAAVVGVLFMKAHLLCDEAKEEGDIADAEGS